VPREQYPSAEREEGIAGKIIQRKRGERTDTIAVISNGGGGTKVCAIFRSYFLNVKNFPLQVANLEKSLEATRQELKKLRVQADKEKEDWRVQEQKLSIYLKESQSHERKLEGQKHNLEVCLADATQQLQELEVFIKKRDDVTLSGINCLYNFRHALEDQREECGLSMLSCRS